MDFPLFRFIHRTSAIQYCNDTLFIHKSLTIQCSSIDFSEPRLKFPVKTLDDYKHLNYATVERYIKLLENIKFTTLFTMYVIITDLDNLCFFISTAGVVFVKKLYYDWK